MKTHFFNIKISLFHRIQHVFFLLLLSLQKNVYGMQNRRFFFKIFQICIIIFVHSTYNFEVTILFVTLLRCYLSSRRIGLRAATTIRINHSGYGFCIRHLCRSSGFCSCSRRERLSTRIFARQLQRFCIRSGSFWNCRLESYGQRQRYR